MKEQTGSVLSRWQRLVKRFNLADLHYSARRSYRPALEALEDRQAPTDLLGTAIGGNPAGHAQRPQAENARAQTVSIPKSEHQSAARHITWFDSTERQAATDRKEETNRPAEGQAKAQEESLSTDPITTQLADDPLGNILGNSRKKEQKSSTYLADGSSAGGGANGGAAGLGYGAPASSSRPGTSQGGNSGAANSHDADRKALQTLVSQSFRGQATPGQALSSIQTTPTTPASSNDWRPSNTDLVAAGFTSMNWQGKEVFARPGEWIVRFDGISGPRAAQTAQIDQLVAGIGLSVKTVIGDDGLAVLHGASNRRFDDVNTALSRLPGYRYAEPNQALWVRAMPNDPRFTNGDLWGLHNTGQNGGTADADIDAPEAWDVATGNSNIVVGVIDTGVDYTHPDLAGNIWVNPFETAGDGIDNDANGFIDDIHGANFITGSGNPMDDHDHGTHVSGTIAGVGNNAVGVVGVNWNTQIMGLKFLSASGSGSIEDAVEALDYANDMRARGVNIRLTSNSWGGGGFSQAMKDEIDRSASLGLLFVAAAGNSGQNADVSPMYPAAYTSSNIISVAATDRNDNIASFSNWGATSVDLGAPGVDTWSTVAGGGYASFSGTSMATPHVAGVAALAFGRNDTLSWEFVKDAILNGVDPNNALRVGGPKPVLTGGRLNAFNTIQMIPGPTTAGPYVTNYSPRGTLNTSALSFFEFTFNGPMNTSSFSIAADVASFTGPGGVDLKPTISSFSWSADAKKLRINFAPKRGNGAYTMVIGPQILDAQNRPMDQDYDGTAGEATQDRYTATVTHTGGAGAKILSHTPSATALAPTSVTFTFSEAMNTTSFSVADVASFTGPGGANLLAQITGFSWVNSTTLKVNFNAQATEGTYSMVVGPQILAASDGAAMDQDADNLAGEATQDRYTASFVYDSAIGPDGFGYTASGTAPLNIDLVAGAPGVVTLLDNVLDGYAALNLGTNAFNFYGTTYTGANQLFVSTEGVITFGSGTSQYWNEDLTLTPSQATLAVLWDDWNTSLSTTDKVLYRFDDLNTDGVADRLVVEWENVLHYDGGTAATFQAILGLNTGSNASEVIYNYRDLDVSDPTLSEGASATVGIKAAGTQGLRRLLVSKDTATSPFVGTGKAIRISRNVAGPFIINHTPTGTIDTLALNYLEFNFDVAINPASFVVADDVVSFTGPGGVNLKPTISSFSFSNGNKTLRLNFTATRANGTYTLVLGPGIQDTLGRSMDQDADGIAGEAIEDRYTATVAHSGAGGPRVESSTPATSATAPTSITFTFNEAMNTTSYSVADVRSFTGPGGQNLLSQIAGFTWVNSTTLRVTFSAQPLEGTYTMALGPQVLAASDNRAMDQDRDAIAGEDVQDRYTATVKYSTALGPDGYGYEASAVPIQAIDLVAGAPGVVTVVDNADDSFAAVNLGTNTFRFYGTSYTGASSILVSSNGLITFGSGNSSYSNDDLTSYPAERAIAPFWDDLHTGRTAADKVLYKLDDANADGTPERLIIEWSEVNFYSGGTQPLTFQAILQLNTGTNAGAITFNYPDLVGGYPSGDNGASATVGIKDTGTQGPNRLLVSFNTAASPYVGTGKAIRISQNGSISGQIFNDANANGIQEAGEAGLANATVYIDADNDGVKDAGEISVLSNSGGFYSLPHLPFGTYVVRQVAPGYVQTLPASGGSRTVTLASGQNVTGQNFGNYKPNVYVFLYDSSAAEGASPANPGSFYAYRTGPVYQPLTVFYTMSGTATNGTDYTAMSGSVTIPVGAYYAIFTVNPLNDTLVEGAETATVNLTANTNYNIVYPSATLTIYDDERPSLSVSAIDPTATETAGNPATFRITRTPGTTAALTVNYTVSGTAANGTDYVSLSGTAVIAAGAAFVDVTVTPINDSLVEGRETVIFNLVDSAAYQVQTRTATATIHDDELPTVDVTVTDYYAYEPGTDTGRFRITRSSASSTPLTVNYTLTGTAGNGIDYATLSGTVTIPANATFADIVVTALDDTLVEPYEYVTLTLTPSSAFQTGIASGSVYIFSNE